MRKKAGKIACQTLIYGMVFVKKLIEFKRKVEVHNFINSFESENPEFDNLNI